MVTERRAVGRNPYWPQIVPVEISSGSLSRTQFRFSLQRGLGPCYYPPRFNINFPAMESAWQRPIQLA